MKRTALLLLLVVSWLAPLRGGAQATFPDIAVSTPLLADIVSNVAGAYAHVFSVMPESADPHTWEATADDIVRVTEADSFISIGAHLEPFVESGPWRRAVIDGGLAQLTIADHVDLIEVDKVIDHGDHVHDLREGDPHIWLDPNKVIEAVPVIISHLSELNPANSSEYQANGAAYIAQLQQLDADLAEAFAVIPEANRVLVVFHDAYTYFAQRYDFEIVGVVLNNPEAEVSARELADLAEIIETWNVQVVFAEPQFNTEVLEVFAQEHHLEIGELLTDSFAGKVDSYIGLMLFNRDSLVHYLSA